METNSRFVAARDWGKSGVPAQEHGFLSGVMTMSYNYMLVRVVQL